MSPEHPVQGFRLPSCDNITPNEVAWIAFLRDISGGTDPSPTLKAVQVLQQALADRV